MNDNNRKPSVVFAPSQSYDASDNLNSCDDDDSHHVPDSGDLEMVATRLTEVGEEDTEADRQQANSASEEDQGEDIMPRTVRLFVFFTFSSSAGKLCE